LLVRLILSVMIFWFPTANIQAGGGSIIQSDVCVIWIDFYSAHFTAYQPASSGNTQFCQDLPDTGETIFVLDYLHQSLKEVPVDFRIIRDGTGQGRFVKLKHVQALGDIEDYTVFYQPAVIQADASLKVEYDFKSKGSYIVIVTAGHPVNDTLYTAVFPFEVGARSNRFVLPSILFAAGLVIFLLRRRLVPGAYRKGAKN
jgi:hypothetical protein